MTLTIDPGQVASRYREELRAQLAADPEPLRLVGILAADQGPAKTYATYAERACSALGIRFELRHQPRLLAEAAIREANDDPGVHGIIIYYPVWGNEHDTYLRNLVEPVKDIEGMHSSWARALYENRRFIDAARTKKAILPCTPLAILKLIDEAGYFRPGERPLSGRQVTIFNRSEVVGHPLAAMLANDGARVYSFDVHGPLLFEPPDRPDGAFSRAESEVTRKQALSESDIVITGVPSRAFELVQSSEVRQGALCINFSTFKNFADDITGPGSPAAVFIPRIGPMTVQMVIRNALRLRDNARRS